jgi:hypothetical protein
VKVVIPLRASGTKSRRGFLGAENLGAIAPHFMRAFMKASTRFCASRAAFTSKTM